MFRHKPPLKPTHRSFAEVINNAITTKEEFYKCKALTGLAYDAFPRPKPMPGKSVAHTKAWRRWRRRVNYWRRDD